MQTSAASKPRQTQLVPIEKIKPSPNNARKDFPAEYIASLAATIDRDGLQQPPRVRPVNGHFELVYGECRVRAHGLLKRKEVECFVEATDDATAERISLIENIKRRDLTVFEEARELKRLHEVQKLKIEDLAQQVGIAVRTVRENIKLATVAPGVQKLVLEEKLKLSLAKLLSRLSGADTQETVASKAIAEQMTHEELEKYIREHHMQDLRFAPFDIKAKGFECLAATCVECPRNARNLKEEMPELKGDVCTSPEHYQKKVILFGKAEAARQGGQFMDGRHLFNRWGELDRDPNRRSGKYVVANEKHPKDPKERPWRDLISAEEFKKLLVIVLTPKNELLELLDNEKGGVDAAVKAEGKLAKAIARKTEKDMASAPKTEATSREQSEKEYLTLLLKQRVAAAVIAQLVAKMTKWPKVEVLKATARQTLNDLDLDWSKPEPGKPPDGLPQRRGWESLDAAEKAIDKMKENEVLTLIWEATFEVRMFVIQGGLSQHLLDFAKLLGVDVKKTEAELKDKLEWVENFKEGTEIPGTETKNGCAKTKATTVMFSVYGKCPFQIDVFGVNDVQLFWWTGNAWLSARFKTIQHARAAAEEANRTGKAPKGDDVAIAAAAKKPASKKAAKAKKGGGK